MSQFEKAKLAFKSCTGPFPYADVLRILSGLGYVQDVGGKTSGSGRTFYHPETKHIVKFHAPHGKEMKLSSVRSLRENLEDAGVI